MIERELREASASLFALKKRFPAAFSGENHVQLTLAINCLNSILEDFEKVHLDRPAPTK
jgi:hypothetical protein